MLEEKDYSQKEWDEIIFPKIGKEIIDISFELPNFFLMFGQLFKGKILEKETNLKFIVTGWSGNMVNKPYVSLVKEEAGK